MWGRLRQFISGPVSRVFTETVCSVILIFILLSLTLYAVFGPYAGAGIMPGHIRGELEGLFLYLDHAESIYSNYLEKTSTVPEGSESLASFMRSFMTEEEHKTDPYGEHWLLAHISDKETSSDYLLSSIAPRMRERGGLYTENFNNLQDISCFFGRSAISPDYAYIGLKIPEIENARVRVYASILASMRRQHYFFTDAPGAYYNDEERIMVYIKIPSSDMENEK